MIRELMFGYFGNGITVADKLHEEAGDYKKVAHIDQYRQITWYVNLEAEYVREVEQYAASADPTVSTLQDWKVFRTNTAGESQ